MNTKGRKTPIDEIVDEKLPPRIKKAIKEMHIDLEELADWEDNKQRFDFKLSPKGLSIKINFELSLLQVVLIIAGLAGASGLLWGATHFLVA